MKITFPFESRQSGIFKTVKRPMAKVDFWSKKSSSWLEYNLIVDTGADYTLLTCHTAFELGINLEKDCQPVFTKGVGGIEKVHFLKKGLRMKIGNVARIIPIGFLEREDIPFLLGREGCLNDFEVCFLTFNTIISL
ncbi:MAG: aspartyl protease family protein [Patescibacteria group bacterium]